MDYNDDYADAETLTAEARGAADAFVQSFLLNTYLPSVENLTLQFDFTVNDVALSDRASFRSWNTGPDYGRTEGSTSKSGKLPPMSRGYRVNEYEMLLLAQQTDGLEAKQVAYARRAGIAIGARVVAAQAEAIEYGKLTLDERDLVLEVNYGRQAALATTAPKLWTDAASTPIDDLLNAQDVYRDINGSNPGVHLFSSRVLATLQRNPDIIAAIYAGSASTPSRAKLTDVLTVLQDFGVANPTQYDEQVDKVPVFSTNAVLQLPSSGMIVLEEGPLGSTQWGVTAEALQPMYGVSGGDRPGVFAAAFSDHNPERMEVVGSAVVIPAVQNADATGRLEVIAA